MQDGGQTRGLVALVRIQRARFSGADGSGLPRGNRDVLTGRSQEVGRERVADGLQECA